MSRVSHKIHDLRNDVTNCCPLCSKPWQPPEGLQVYHGLVFWKGEEIIVYPRLYDTLVAFLQNLGRPLTAEALHYLLYGSRADGGPIGNVVNVNICKLRRIFKDYKIPLVIHCVSKGHGQYGNYIMTEVNFDGRNHTPQRPQAVQA